MTTPSMYSPIWERIKKDDYCRITAPTPLHKRIIKAVIKRKHEDLAFKLLLSERGKRARISHSVKGTVIEFRLTYSIGLEDLK